MSIIDTYCECPLLGCGTALIMQINGDTPVDYTGPHNTFCVRYKGKDYKYFSSLAGAEAYKEMLENGSDR